MKNSPLTIWCNAQFEGIALSALQEGTRAHRLIISSQLSASNLVQGAADPAMEGADVAFGQPDPADAMRFSRLRWIHLTSAGYTRYDQPAFWQALSERGAALTNSSGVYAEPCAEHVFSFMLALARQLPQTLAEQRGKRGWSTATHRARSRLLRGQKVVLLGFGAIARRLVQMIAPFEMEITAVRRKAAAEPGVTIIAEVALERVIGEADHVVNILPETSRTRGMIDARIFAAMRRGAVFYNIGRGTTVDQQALAESLRSGQLSAAYLDVTDPEPLPRDHPLWELENCFITPHTAGGFDKEQEALVRHFLGNLRRFEEGAELVDRVG